MKLSDVIVGLQDRLEAEGDFQIPDQLAFDVTQKSINPKVATQEALAELSRMEEFFNAVPTKDYVREYGVFVGDSRIRHFIDKPNGGKTTLCGLECEFVEGESIGAERSCERCADRQTELRSK